MPDYAHTTKADRDRSAKAKTLASHLYLVEHLRPEQVYDLPETARRNLERAATINRASDETWALAAQMIRDRMEWEVRSGVVPIVDQPAPVPAPAPPAVIGDVDAPCMLWISGEQRWCGATPTRHYLPGRRCEAHTPAMLKGAPEPAPDPESTLAAITARRGLPSGPIPAPSNTVIDDRHVASGKRRANPDRVAEARANIGGGRRAS